MKTGVAVLITALICDFLDWPAMFAVITAIVTIEPTAADSIKKAFIRFPASALGAGFAVLFSYFLGDTPITYALVTLATIITCTKLHLHAGTLVAVLTGVAMISTIHDEFVSSFFIRLGTTTTGLVVSSLVNLLLLPPNYSETISKKVHQLYIKTGTLLEKRGIEVIKLHPLQRETKMVFREIQAEIEQVEKLCQYQKEEWRLHRTIRKDLRYFHYEYKKLTLLRQILYHLGNLIHLPAKDETIPEHEEVKILTAIQSIKNIIHHPQFEIDDGHYSIMEGLLEDLWVEHPVIHEQSFKSIKHHFSNRKVLKYELLSIHDLLNELVSIQEQERQHFSMLRRNLKKG
ncbi:aromatic acid exporter family protein [Bacillus carboniphilus]